VTRLDPVAVASMSLDDLRSALGMLDTLIGESRADGDLTAFRELSDLRATLADELRDELRARRRADDVRATDAA